VGVVAANRGIKTSGLYRVVRHPAYAGYLLGYLGYVISYPTAQNVALAVATLLALNARAIIEERFLAQDPAYRAYLNGTRWRFVLSVYCGGKRRSRKRPPLPAVIDKPGGAPRRLVL